MTVSHVTTLCRRPARVQRGLRRTALICTAVSAISAAPVHAAVQHPTAPLPIADSADLAAFVDGILTAQMQDHDLSAAAVSIVQGGRIILARGYGLADRERGEPVDPATSLFHIGSTGKLFTGPR